MVGSKKSASLVHAHTTINKIDQVVACILLHWVPFYLLQHISLLLLSSSTTASFPPRARFAPPDVIKNIVDPVRTADLVRSIVRRPVPAGVTILTLGL